VIIGISGKKGSGKDTVADYCIGQLPVHEYGSTLAFADALKELYADYCLGREIHWGLLNKQSFKKQEHICGKTHRQMLQEIGVAMRGIWPDIWVHRWNKIYDDLCSLDDVCFVPDVRFSNEVKKIQDLGGKVLRLTRTPHDDQHESETALDEMEKATVNNYSASMTLNTSRFDHVLDNSDMGVDEANEAAWGIIRGWIG
jgi:hypothetical protein